MIAIRTRLEKKTRCCYFLLGNKTSGNLWFGCIHRRIGSVKERDGFERLLRRQVGRCVSDFNLISEGDRIMVCSSGGKDSYVLLDILDRLRRRAPIRFSLVAVHFDPGIPGHDSKPLESWFDSNGFEYEVVRENIYPLLLRNTADGETCCPMCSRLRRGILYNTAQRLGCTKVALGHNRDDTVETLLLNLLYTGSLKAMPPKLVSDDGRNTVIRPLLYASETSILAYARSKGYPLLSCRLYDDNKKNRREDVKQLLRQIERMAPQAINSIISAMTNVRATHLLDRNLWRRLKIEE